MSYAKLDRLNRQLDALNHAMAILGVDEAVMMPEGGGAARAEAMGTLAGMFHKAATAPEVADWIAAAEAEDLGDDQRVALAEFRREHTNMTCLPSEFVEKRTQAAMKCEQAWRKLRPSGDWDGFAKELTEVVAMVRDEAAMRSDALGLAPYDALMEQYDPGNRTAWIDPLFTELKAFLVDFVPEALAAQEQRLATSPLQEAAGPFPIENQRLLGVTLMSAVGFDTEHGRLDVSHHPFCGGVPDDVRITTRYATDNFVTAMMAVLHETGHAQYEQGLPKDNAHWPSAKARGMGVHESQSLFVEQQLVRAPSFWEWALPIAKEHIGLAIADWSVTDMLTVINHVERGLIRVDADQCTYPLHVILRYEIEKGLISGDIKVADIPDIWNAKMSDYLGLDTKGNFIDGPMQDVHWSGGAIGYFPSYTLGSMMAAQQFAALEKAEPAIHDQINRGEFGAVNAWRSKNIWLKASTVSAVQIMEDATGEPLNAEIFKSHLKSRYLN